MIIISTGFSNDERNISMPKMEIYMFGVTLLRPLQVMVDLLQTAVSNAYLECFFYILLQMLRPHLALSQQSFNNG